MSRYIDSVCRLCRREGMKLFLKGEKCHTKCVLDARPTPPGAAKPQRGKPSEYAIRLREKQKLRRLALVGENTMRQLISRASQTPGQTGETLLRYLELRLDNVCRRLGFASSIKTARQLVSHGHVQVNGRRVDIPSFIVNEGDKVTLTSSVRETPVVKIGLDAIERRGGRPAYLQYDANTYTGTLLREPSREEMSFPVNERLIVEFYSK
jgi:small subunit ribosomal protein S4